MANVLDNSVYKELTSKLVIGLHAEQVFAKITDGKFLSGLRSGISYPVPSVGAVNVGDYVGDPITRQKVIDSKTTVLIDQQKYFDVAIDEPDAQQAEVALSDMVEEGKYELAQEMDQFISAGLVAGAGSVNPATTYDTLNVTGVAMGALVEINTGVTGVSSGTAVIGDGTVIGVQTVLGTLYVNDSTDVDVAAAAQAALNTLGVDGAPITVDESNIFEYLGIFKTTLVENNAVLRNSVIVLPPHIATILQNARAGAGSAAGTDEQRNGWVDKILGLNIYESTDMPDGVVSGTAVLAFEKRAYKWRDSMKEIMYYQPDETFEDAAKALHVYGGKVITKINKSVVLGYVA